MLRAYDQFLQSELLFAQTQIRMKHMPNLRSFLLENSCKDDPLIVSPSLIKSPIQSYCLSFTKEKDLALDKKIEGLASNSGE